MTQETASPSARRTELLEAAYRYVLDHGLADLSLRPLAAAIGSSPRVLLFLFGSKDGLIRELLARARADELAFLGRLDGHIGLATAAERLWEWIAAPERRPLVRLWIEAYGRSLVEPDGAWAGFAKATVDDWLAMLTECEPGADPARRTLVLAVLRGAFLDLIATGDADRTGAAVRLHLDLL
ncbi:TetR family transcriptional regulator [Glycomyces dulcitolivorans]|uniref:TetR family transcriptional regulator n=1 Tax=Glycomyces dulcitolivorans TaxID=2200759 RepID=UPI000DD319ED|nr:TetR family transcriptional regulator [Glycomyces dulcitolivorans]